MTFEIYTAVGAFVVSLVTALIFGKFFIPFMRRMHFGQEIREDGPKWHMSKAGTPTMGGFLFISGIVVSCVVGVALLAACSKNGVWTPVVLTVFSLGFGVIGFLDDFVKVAKHRILGLTVVQKLLLQLALSLAFVSLLRHMGLLTPNVYIPFFDVTVPVSWVLYLVLAVLAISGAVNAVNFTDGVDGLLGCVTLPVMAFFAVVAIARENVGAAIFAAAAAGGLIGFLVYNFNPAKIFMGDTGSLFLGGAVCAVALALDLPLILLVVGIIYVIEIFSVVLQVCYFKLTHGKRIFRMAPIHHHFEMGGWSEKKLCAVFGGVTALMCVITLFGIGIL